MFKYISKYWLCQILGWGTMMAISLFFVYTSGKIDSNYTISLLISCLLGIFITHMMRYFIHYYSVLKKPVSSQLYYFIILTLIFSILFGGISEAVDYIAGVNPERLQKYSTAKRIFLSSFNSLWLIGIWNLIYYLYHYIETNRKQELDTLRLEAMVKSLELKTIKSHINPHFIFNALNSIRALVDENPERARRAITELSNILRSSMRAEQMETVPLQQELDIVKDYLALEQMRFEERLKVNFDIDADTLNQPVPPMMLQTLVENAIKHGINKQEHGGFITVRSVFVNNHHELLVINSGIYQSKIDKSETGFGIKSTQDRLNLLYQGKANFEIHDMKNNTVQSKIIIPITEIL